MLCSDDFCCIGYLFVKDWLLNDITIFFVAFICNEIYLILKIIVSMNLLC